MSPSRYLFNSVGGGKPNESKYHLSFPRLNHTTQCVQFPEESSRFIIAHSCLFGFFGKVSRKETPRKFFKSIFLTASSISKLLRGLIGKIAFSTRIIYSKHFILGTTLHQILCMFHFVLLFEKEYSQTRLQNFRCQSTPSKSCYEFN